MLIANDLHLGVLRSAGTTPSSAAALRQYALDSFEQLLARTDEHLVILGDLFDQYNVPMTDLLKTFKLLETWLQQGHKLTLMPGNHDLSTDSSKLGSFQFLGALLADVPQVTYIPLAGWVEKEVYAISHCVNQDEFNLQLSKVPECRYVLLHANYDNTFAVESDHSLNVSEQQAKDCKAQTLVFAHEHNHRKLLGGKVYVLGNQFPTSVSDCLSDQDKFMHRLTPDGIERIKFWDRATSYAELDWRNPTETTAQFVRFTGTATPEEGAAVADTIARYRKASDAFVVSNAVKIGSEDRAEFEVQSLDQARSFDVMGALKKFLTEDEYSILEKLE
jgi:metallophosphoesterase superfamily enzyme